MIDKRCPCTKDCPDRNPAYCKVCEKGKSYKNMKFAEYEQSNREFDFRLYESKQINRAAKAAKEFRKGLLR